MGGTAANEPVTRSSFPRWKIWASVAAFGLILSGLGLKLQSHLTRPGEGDQVAGIEGSSPPPGAHSLMENPGTKARSYPPGDGEIEAAPPARPTGLVDRLSPALLGGGISFFAGLAVGTVLRLFFKIFLILAGIGILGAAALSFSGIVGPIDWRSLENWTIDQIDAAEEKTAGFGDQLIVLFPSAGLAGAGLVTGVKKK